MGRDFYPFVEENTGVSKASEGDEVLKDDISYPARIAVYDDPSVTPRVVVIEPTNVRDFLASITETVTKLAQGQGGTIPFTIIRELVENFIHAKFIEPTITILDGGNTIRFCDQGPGIKEKEQALQFGTTSATDDMKHYIRGVGSGLPIAQQYMIDKGGSLTIQDNINGGTIVTISTRPQRESQIPCVPHTEQEFPGEQNGEAGTQFGQPSPQGQPHSWDQTSQVQAPAAQQGWGQQGGYVYPQGQGAYGQPPQQGFPQGGYPQQGFPQSSATNPFQQPYGQQGQPAQLGQAPQGWQQPWQQGAPQQNPYPQQPENPYATQWQQAQGWQRPPAQGMTGGPGHFFAGEGTGGCAGVEGGTGQEAASPFAAIQVSTRGSLILGYLSTHESVGGVDLVNQYGGSQPTWSRELKVLDEKGLTRKEGQKRRLTDIGRAYLASLAG